MANAVQGAVFVTVGSRMSMRPVWSGDKLAVQAFAAWWFLYGVQAILASVRLTAVAGGAPDVGLYMLLFSVETVLAFLALGGLILYVAYLWHGKYLAPTLVFVTLATLGFLYVVILQWHDPRSIIVDGFRTDVAFGRALEDPFRWLLILGYYGPVLALAGMFGYVGSISRSPQKRRALAMTGLLVVLCAADTLALGPHDLGAFGWVPTVLRVIAAAVAGTVFLRSP